METILGLVVGLIAGVLAGGLIVGLVMKLRSGGEGTRLRTELDAANKRIQDAERHSDENKRDAEEQREKVAQGDVKIAELNTAFQASQENFQSLEDANKELKAQSQELQTNYNNTNTARAALQVQYDNLQTQYAAIAKQNVALTDQSQELQTNYTNTNTKLAELQAQFNALQTQSDDIAARNAALIEQSQEWQTKYSNTDKTRAELQAQLDAANKRLAEQTDIEKTLLDQFKVMANEAISNNSDEFIKAADEKLGAIVKQANKDFSLSKDAVSDLVKPLSEELKRIEEARNKAQGGLTQQIASLVENNNSLANETRNLSTALNRPEGRGYWGEIQLERVAELAGLAKNRDYRLQVNVASEDGKSERPDMIVDMPNGRNIVVDAKAPMQAYLDAVKSDNEAEREELMRRHARQVRERVRDLGRKSYQQRFNSPDFVVMFLPGEFFLQPALEKDPELLERAMQQKVVIATPNTLIALLKTVDMGWREVQLAKDAKRIGELGKELHDRLYTFAGHMANMRKSLNTTVGHFNKGVGSLEGNVLIPARKFKELGVQSSRDIPEIDEISNQANEFKRALRALPEAATAGDD